MEHPKTLLEAVQYFADFENCKAFMSGLRWPDGVVKCPNCGSDHVVWLENARLWKCYAKHERPKFSLKTGTIFEDSPLGLDKWLAAAWLICNCKNGISSYEIVRDLGISQKSAWHMMHRLRFAFHHGNFNKLRVLHAQIVSRAGHDVRRRAAGAQNRRTIRNASEQQRGNGGRCIGGEPEVQRLVRVQIGRAH